MPKKLLFAFLALSLLVSACQLKTDESSEPVSQEGEVSLASEEGMVQPLTASFLSAHGGFAYSLTYDGSLLSLMETDDASSPYFEVNGGSTLLMNTDWVSTVADEAEMAGAPVRVGAYDVYQFMDAEGTCSLNVTLVPYSEEVLRVSLKICEGNDGDSGREALQQVLDHLVLEAR